MICPPRTFRNGIGNELGERREVTFPPSPYGWQTLSTDSQFENNYFTEMCSVSEAGSYLRLIDSMYHSNHSAPSGMESDTRRASVARRSSCESGATLHSPCERADLSETQNK